MNKAANSPRDTVKESASEVRDKLKSDFTGLKQRARIRRGISLKPMVACPECEASGKIACLTCGGSGEQRVVWNDTTEKCPSCQGTGQTACSNCMGRRMVPNANRKKLLWVLLIGGLGWGYILFRLWGGDILPEQQSKYLAGGGGGGATSNNAQPLRKLGAPGSMAPPNGMNTPGGTGQPGQPNGAVGQPGTMGGQPGGMGTMGGPPR